MSPCDLIPTLHYDAQTVMDAAGTLERFAGLSCEILLLDGSKRARNLTASDNRGFFYRFFSPWMKVISKKWQMYPVGVIFGMGFDTVAEVPAPDDHRVPGL